MQFNYICGYVYPKAALSLSIYLLTALSWTLVPYKVFHVLAGHCISNVESLMGTSEMGAGQKQYRTISFREQRPLLGGTGEVFDNVDLKFW